MRSSESMAAWVESRDAYSYYRDDIVEVKAVKLDGLLPLGAGLMAKKTTLSPLTRLPSRSMIIAKSARLSTVASSACCSWPTKWGSSSATTKALC